MKTPLTQTSAWAGFFRVAALVAACAVLCSCASVPTQDALGERLAKRFDPPPAGWSGLYVYRTGVVGSSLKRKVWVDGQYAGETGYGTFLRRLVRPGMHWVQTESALGPRELFVEFAEGRNHFVQQRFVVSGGKFDDDKAKGLSLGERFFGDTDLVERPHDVAAGAIADLHLVLDSGDNRAFDLPDADYAVDKGSRSATKFRVGDFAAPPPKTDVAAPVSLPDGGSGVGTDPVPSVDPPAVPSTDAEVKAAEEAARLRALKMMDGVAE